MAVTNAEHNNFPLVSLNRLSVGCGTTPRRREGLKSAGSNRDWVTEAIHLQPLNKTKLRRWLHANHSRTNALKTPNVYLVRSTFNLTLNLNPHKNNKKWAFVRQWLASSRLQKLLVHSNRGAVWWTKNQLSDSGANVNTADRSATARGNLLSGPIVYRIKYGARRVSRC